MARCFAVIGATGTGKSTLVDRLAMIEGRAPPAAGPSGTRIARFGFLGEDWTALDCPGAVDFLQESRDALLAADAAVIVVPPDPEAAVLSAPFLRMVEEAGTPAFLFVNRMDEPKGRVRDIVGGLQAYANHVMVLRQVPIREGDRVVGAIDLVSERAWRYREGEPSALILIPPAAAAREHEARAELLEHLSEFDDWLLEEIIEDHEPPRGQVHAICARAFRDNRVMPVLIGSAGHANGVVRLMKALRHEAPGADTLAARLAAQAGLGEAPLAVAFHAVQRRHLGRTVHLRALSPGLRTGAALGGASLGSLVEIAAGLSGTPAEAEPGAVVGAVKSDAVGSGLVLGPGRGAAPPWLRPAEGELRRLLRPRNERDDVKLSTTLAKVGEDDRALRIDRDPATGALRVAAPGPLALRHLREMLEEVFGLATEEAPVPPVYCEAISRPAKVHFRHRKQTGGAGQFADVHLTVEPMERGAGFVFADAVKGGAVPRNYIPAVEHGAREALAKGPLGFPVVDVKVTLTDGQHHAVDSSDMAFRIAGRGAVAQALAEAVPVLLQPMHLVTFAVPAVFTGGLGAVVAALRGHVLGFDRDPGAKGWDLFRAILPEAALDDLAAQIRSVTQGVGRFTAAFDHFEEVYGREADRIAEARRAG